MNDSTTNTLEPSPPRAVHIRKLRLKRSRLSAHLNEGGAAAVAPKAASVRTSMAALLAGHILRDGEVVLLILKPSIWFIFLTGLRFHAAVLIAMIGAKLGLGDRGARGLVEFGMFLIFGRLTWSLLQWMGRLYVLTDMRIVRLSGIFHVDIFDCALRKVADTRISRTFRERVCRVGSIEITPMECGSSAAPSTWQTIHKPAEVLAKIRETIHKARQGDGMM